MPVKVYCPSCDKELNAPDELVGKTVACPRCNERFPVGEGDNGASPKQHLYPPGVNAFPPGLEPAPRAAASGPPAAPPAPPSRPTASPGAARFRGAPPDVDAAPHAGPPPAPPLPTSQFPGSPASSQAAPPPAAPPPQTLPSQTSPPVSAPAASPPPPTRPASPPAAPPREAPRGPAQRTVKQARFITAGETATHMKLGADGQLPQLALREGEQREKKTEEKQGMNPLILIAFLVSVGFSVVILLLPQESESESRAKADARNALEQDYIKGIIDPTATNKSYQSYLREALQAHRIGDYQTELNRYRRVMNLLHSEGIREKTGLTGKLKESYDEKGNPNPAGRPNDEHLEKQLSILLRDNL